MVNMADTGRVIIFVGGPEDGRVIKGQEALLLTLKPEPTDQEGVFQLTEPKIGASVKVTSSRMLDAFDKLGTDALAYYDKLGVSEGNRTMNRYCLREIIDGLYVYRFEPSDD